jgi:hypothetical protein
MTVPRGSVWWLALLLAGPGAARADLFVSSRNTSSVLEYNGATGTFVRTFASGGVLSGPQGLAFGPNGDLFVSSGGTNSVLEYNGATGVFVRTFASGGVLSGPTFLAFSPAAPAVPEPSSLALMAGGGLLAATAAASARRRRGWTRA